MSLARNLLARATAALAATALAALQGCSTTPRFDSHFGQSVRANLAAQVLDPAAAANADPASGIDGAAARAAQERYRQSFSDAPAARPPLVGGGEH